MQLGIVLGVFQAIFNAISDTIVNAVNTWKNVLEGIITFLTGIFTGNWEQAFDGLIQIAKGIFDGLVGAVKIPINLVIDIFNGFIGGLNSIRIPDWVPVIGGAGINIPLIPRLKKGMNFVPKDFFPAYLDYGERVLTREENAVFTAVGGLHGRQDMLEEVRTPPQYPGGARNTMQIEVPIYLDGREIARASAWYTGEQLAWEER